MSSARWFVPAVVALVCGLALTSCSSGEPDAAPTPTPSASVSSAPPAPTAPAVGSCHRLTLPQATAPVDAGAAVPCRGAHTSVTIRVGTLPTLADGHLLAADSRAVRDALDAACPSRPTSYLGGDRTAQRLSRLRAVWFRPSLTQADAGADWFRCDVVGLSSPGRLLPLPASLKGALSRPDALDRYGTCATADPSARRSRRVVCSAPHAWRAVETVDLPAAAGYLDRGVAARGDAACKAVASRRAAGALRFSWSFEWPTRPRWRAGQRWGTCWVPEA